MAVKKRKTKKEPLTIKSTETKILFGIILAIVGLAVLVSPFFCGQTEIFTKVATYLGYSAILWGVFIIYLSFFLFFKKKRFISHKQAIGIFLFSICLSILLTFWLPEEKLEDETALQGAGGLLGSFLHLKLHSSIGGLIELIIVLVIRIIAVSLITGTTLEQIRDFIETNIPENDGESSGIRGFQQEHPDMADRSGGRSHEQGGMGYRQGMAGTSGRQQHCPEAAAADREETGRG